MPKNAHTIISIPFSRLDASALMLEIDQKIQQKRQTLLTVLDAAMVINMKSSESTYNAVCESDVLVADGYYVALALKFLNYGPIEQITGYNTTLNILKLAKQKGYKVFFFGAEESVVRKVVDYAGTVYGDSIVAGYRNGYFQPSEAESIVESINHSGANILLVGISSPIRELFFSQYRDRLHVSLLMGVGGVFDVLGGKTRNAPEWIRSLRLEWFYRFIQEPRRMWKRVFYSYPYFVFCVLVERLAQIRAGVKVNARTDT